MSIKEQVHQALQRAHIGRNGVPVPLTGLYLDRRSWRELCHEGALHDFFQDGHGTTYQGVPVFIVERVHAVSNDIRHLHVANEETK
jgi:hypothetical protein